MDFFLTRPNWEPSSGLREYAGKDQLINKTRRVCFCYVFMSPCCCSFEDCFFLHLYFHEHRCRVWCKAERAHCHHRELLGKWGRQRLAVIRKSNMQLKLHHGPCIINALRLFFRGNRLQRLEHIQFKKMLYSLNRDGTSHYILISSKDGSY